MKIEAKCDVCGRVFLLSQIGPGSDSPGRCPFCGARFARHYSPLVVDWVREAEEAAAQFITTIGRLQGVETGFQIDLRGLLRELDEQVRRYEEPAAS
jgi:hypothetical protein